LPTENEELLKKHNLCQYEDAFLGRISKEFEILLSNVLNIKLDSAVSVQMNVNYIVCRNKECTKVGF